MAPAFYGPVTKTEIETVAHATVASLKACGFMSCLVGGTACMAYGITRIPNVSICHASAFPMILMTALLFIS